MRTKGTTARGGRSAATRRLTHRATLAAAIAFAILIAAASVALAAAYNAWTAQTSGTTQTLYGIAMPDGTHGWAIGGGGTIRTTTNGGTNWAAQTSGTTQTLNAVAFADTTRGWAVGGRGTIRATTNGGTNWAGQTSGTTSTLRGVAFVSTTRGWVAGSNGLIRTTANGGTNWTAQTSGTTQTLYGVAFPDATHGWAVGATSTIRVTTNGGTNWAGQTAPVTGRTLYGVAFADASNGWIVGSNGVIFHTINGGTTWTSQTSGVTVTLYAVTTCGPNAAWAFGANGTIRFTIDGGATWRALTSNSTRTLYGAVYSNGKVWTTGTNGTILTSLADITTPVTTATGLQADNHSGWRNASQSVTLSATDTPSGVAATYYTLDGGARQTYSAPFTVSGAGIHTVTYWSVDAGGNTEATHTGYVNIDSTAPTTTATGLQLDTHSGWRSTSQPVTLSATDGTGAVSGVASTWYTVDGGAPVLYTGAPFTVSGNGSHPVTYFSIDAAGNTEATHTGYVNIDSAAPVTTATGLQADNHSGWRITSQQVSLTGDDGNGSGVATTYYALDGGGGQIYSGSFTVSGQGTHFVTYWSVDAVGNTELSHTGWVNIDITAPTVSDDADANWHHTPPTIHLTAADTGGSGVAATQYRAQGSSTWTAATGNAFIVPAPADGSNDGARVYQYRALDNAGNASTTRSCTVWIDATPPVTTATGLQPDMFSGWRTTGQDVDLSADDGAGSGVTATYYAVDGGGTQTYSGTFNVSGYGQHAVTYWSTDVAGNVEATRTGYVNISSPFAQATGLQSDDHTGWRNTPADVTISADGDHQPLTIHYRIGGGSWQTAANPAGFSVGGEGSHPVDYYATNTVNVESIHETGYANIDLTTPATIATGLQPNGSIGWQTSSQLVSLSPTDALSGVAATHYTVDGGSAEPYTAPFTVAGDGSHVVTYWSVDAAGNVETANTGHVNIDLAAPTTTAGGLQANDHSGWRTTAQTVTLNADDAGESGVAHVYYTVDGGGQQTYTGSFSVSGEASHVVTYWSADNVGNVEAVRTGYVNIDATAPSTSAAGLQSDDHSGWRTADQVVSLTPGDAVSGVAHTYYTVDGGATQTYSAPFTVTGEKQHVVAWWSVDAAGNTEAAHTGYVNIDLTAPASTATGLQANDHSGWRTTTQTVALNAGDGSAGSGVAATYYTVDGGAQQTYTASFQVSGEGSHPVTYWSVDAVGNAEAAHTGYVNIDLTAPTTAAAGLQPDTTSGWQNTSQLVTLTPDDGTGSGVASTHYTNGGGTLAYSAPFTVSGQGSHTVTYWSTDAVGNTEATKTGYVNIDTTVPTVGDNADSAWHDSPVSITLTPADTGGSDVAGTQYRLQGSSTWLDTTADVFVVPAPADGSSDGAHVYQYRALDNAGNASVTHTCTVKIDTQGPAVTPTGLQPDSHSGWTTTPQLIKLTADDNGGSGAKTIYYTLDGGAQQTYTGPFTVSGLGSHWVTYWSVDNLGNVSDPTTGYVNIDDPWARASGLADDDHSGWRNASPTVTITGGGDFPPFTIHYRIDGGSWTSLASVATLPAIGAEGSHAVDYYAVNNNGQQSAVTQTGYVNIDKTAPATTASGLQPNATSGWIATSQDVTFGATDARSGVATTYYTVDGGAQQTYTGTPVTVSGKDSHTVTYWSVDAAGNTETTHTGYVNIDLTAPVTTATNLADDDHSGWTTARRDGDARADRYPVRGRRHATTPSTAATSTTYTGALHRHRRRPAPGHVLVGRQPRQRRSRQTPATSTSTPARRRPPPTASRRRTTPAGRTATRP